MSLLPLPTEGQENWAYPLNTSLQQLNDQTVVGGRVVGDNLVLTSADGLDHVAGNVRGEQGEQGEPGPPGSGGVTSVNGKSGPIVQLEAGDIGAYPGQGVFNVVDYGALGDGVTDDTPAFQAAANVIVENGGGTLLVPSGNFPIYGAVRIGSNTRIIGLPGANIVNTIAGSTTNALFAALPGSLAYLENIEIAKLTFTGELGASGVSMCLVVAHRVRGLHIHDIVVNGAINGGHCVDLMGSQSVVIERCVFRGSSSSEARGYAEAIQIDASTLQGMPGGLEVSGETFTGEPTRDVVVRDCRFEKFQSYLAPRPIGSHSAVQDTQYENITFVDNVIQKVSPRLTGELRCPINFVAANNVSIKRNSFIMEGDENIPALVGFFNVSNVVPKSNPASPTTIPAVNNLRGWRLTISENATDSPSIPRSVGAQWTPASLDTNFSAWSNEPISVEYADGNCFIHGAVTCTLADYLTGVTNRRVFTLPSDLRPARSYSGIGPASGTNRVSCSVYDTGTVNLARWDGTQAAGVWVPLSYIAYRV